MKYLLLLLFLPLVASSQWFPDTTAKLDKYVDMFEQDSVAYKGLPEWRPTDFFHWNPGSGKDNQHAWIIEYGPNRKECWSICSRCLRLTHAKAVMVPSLRRSPFTEVLRRIPR